MSSFTRSEGGDKGEGEDQVEKESAGVPLPTKHITTLYCTVLPSRQQSNGDFQP